MDILTLGLMVISFISIYFSIYVLYSSTFKKRYSKLKYYPTISILIPAYNEEKNIEKTIKACLRLNYPKEKLDIIVINDGSTDSTSKICKIYASKGLIKLINKRKNEGKVKSINKVLKKIKSEFFCIVDADTFLSPNSLKQMLKCFNDEKVAAVLSPLKPKNSKKNFLTKLQLIDYRLSYFFRNIFAFDNANFIMNGASMYKTEIIRKIGYFDERNLTEDLEIGLRLIKNGYKLEVAPTSSKTIVPENFKNFFKQRLRWYCGFFQNVFAYKEIIFNPKFGSLGFFVLPLNLFWAFIAIYVIASLIFNTFQEFLNFYLNLKFVGLVETLKFNFKNFYPSFILTSISIVSLISFIFFFLLFEKARKVKRRIFGKAIDLLNLWIYIIFYSMLNSFIWFVALFKSFERKKGWRGK